MILASNAGGGDPGFKSQLSPSLCFILILPNNIVLVVTQKVKWVILSSMGFRSKEKSR